MDRLPCTLIEGITMYGAYIWEKRGIWGIDTKLLDKYW